MSFQQLVAAITQYIHLQSLTGTRRREQVGGRGGLLQEPVLSPRIQHPSNPLGGTPCSLVSQQKKLFQTSDCTGGSQVLVCRSTCLPSAECWTANLTNTYNIYVHTLLPEYLHVFLSTSQRFLLVHVGAWRTAHGEDTLGLGEKGGGGWTELPCFGVEWRSQWMFIRIALNSWSQWLHLISHPPHPPLLHMYLTPYCTLVPSHACTRTHTHTHTHTHKHTRLVCIVKGTIILTHCSDTAINIMHVLYLWSESRINSEQLRQQV